MKRYLMIGGIILAMVGLVYAGTTTTNLSLYKPAVDETGWGASVNTNFDTVDTAVGGYLNSSGEWVDGDWGDMSASGNSVTLDADVVDSAEIADNAIDSEHYTDGSIDAAHLAADIIDETKIADNGIDSEHYNDGSIDAAHLAADIIDETKIADNGIDSEHYNDGSIDTAHLAADVVDATKIADDAIQEEHLKAVDAAADEDFFTYEATTGDFEWHSIADVSAGIAADIAEGELANAIIVDADIKDDVIQEPALNVSNAAEAGIDNYLLSYNHAGTNFTWVAPGAGGEALDATLAIGADANDLDITSLAKLEGVDVNTYIDMDTTDILTTKGNIIPSANAADDLGTDALEFNNAWFDGTMEADTITEGGNAVYNASEVPAVYAENGAEEMLGETMGTACSENQILKANATGGLVCAADADSGGATAWDDIGDPDADGTIAFAGYEQIITSTLDEAGGQVLTITNTDADVANDTVLLTLGYTDDGQANADFFKCVDNSSANTMFQISENGGITTVGDNSVHNFGNAASFEIPNAAAPTVDAAGEIAIDTTSDQLAYYGGAKRILTHYYEKGFVLEDPAAADDNVPFWHPKQNITITDVYCEVEGATSAEVIISDGTNALETVTCDEDGQADDGSIANGTFSANERMEFDIGTVTDTPDWLAVTITYTIDSD